MEKNGNFFFEMGDKQGMGRIDLNCEGLMALHQLFVLCLSCIICN